MSMKKVTTFALAALIVQSLPAWPAIADTIAVDWGGNYIQNPPPGTMDPTASYVQENQEHNYGGGGTPDFRQTIPFSESTRLSPNHAEYNELGLPSAEYYGGYNLIRYDESNTVNFFGVSDYTNNASNDAIMAVSSQAYWSGGEFAGVVVWMKGDFLNGADAVTNLTLDSDCTLEIDIWVDTSTTHRIVVKNGSQYYVSNTTGTAKGLLTISDPTTETWATFNPANTDYRLNDVGSTFTTRTFDDVQALGFYVTAGPSTGQIEPESFIRNAEFEVVVPEPTTLGLLAIGGVALLRRRRR